MIGPIGRILARTALDGPRDGLQRGERGIGIDPRRRATRCARILTANAARTTLARVRVHAGAVLRRAVVGNLHTVQVQPRMRRLQAIGCVAALLAGLSSPGTSAAEAVTGTILYGGPPVAPTKVDVTIDQYVCGRDKVAGDLLVSPRRELRNAVVWIDNPPADRASPVPGDKVEMDQQGCEFIPRVLVVQAGGTVDFLNSDRLLHNIHATPKLNVSFNRTQPKGRTIPATFTKPEIVRINCDLHSWMTAWVVVAAHRYYAVTGADGRFSFDDLPPGRYQLSVWHERLGTTQASVTVAAGQPARVSIEMKAR